MKKDNSLVKAGAVLVFSGFIVKVLSAAYRIPLTRMLGANLMGKYSSVFNLMMPFFAFATAGITPCVSRFTAQLKAQNNAGGIQSLVTAAFRLYLPIAAVMTLCFVAFGRFYASYQQDEIFFCGTVILAPAIIFAAFETVCKGVTQGKMDMMVTAKANVLESVTKTFFGLGAVFLVQKFAGDYSPDLPVAACLASVTVSGGICAGYLLLKVKEKPFGRINSKAKISRRQLLSMSVPISASALVASAVSFFDTAVCLPIIKQLPYEDIVRSFSGASFMGAGEISMYLFGVYQGMVLTVFNLTPAVLASVGVAGMPLMTAAQSTKDKKRLQNQVDKLFRIVGFFSVPAAVFIFTFRSDIVQFLFGTTTGQTVVASSLLSILAPCCVLSCFISAFNAVLNAHGKSHTIFKILAGASAVRCILSFILCGIPEINIKAFAVSNCAYYVIIFVTSAACIKKNGVKLKLMRTLALPAAVAAAVMLLLDFFTGMALYSLPMAVRLFFSGVIYCLIYLLVMLFAGFTVDI